MSWIRFVSLRLVWALALAVLVAGITFVIFHLMPTGDPAALRAGQRATPDQIEGLRQSLGLDRPVYAQFGIFLRDLFLRFDLGYSFSSGMPVKDLVLDRLPVTLLLIAGAALIWIGVGIGAGVSMASRPHSIADRAGGAASLVLISAPVFWVGYVSMYGFAVGVGQLPLLPGIGSWDTAEGVFEHGAALLLPCLVLGLSSAAVYFRLSRAAVRAELDRPYALAARGRGLDERRIRWRHAARSGLTPLFALAGLDLGLLIAGNVILVEEVFNLPGVGSLVTNSVERSDLPTIEGVVLVGTLLLVVVNVLADIAFRVFDPRSRID